MRKPLIFSLTLLAATALLLVGCNPILPSEGNKVKFKAHSKSQPATKTAYAGNAASTGSSHEDIYWSEGDDIRIYSGNTAVVTPAFANYELVISSDKTRATLQNPAEAPNGLAWVTDPAQGNDDVTFYAVYPPSTQGSESGWFTMSIPSEQTFATPSETDMKHAYMLAQNTLTRSQFNSEVSLEFYPAFTAFQINLKSKDDELTLKKFRIYSETNHLAGAYYGLLKKVTTSDEAGNEYFSFNTDKSLRMDFACVLDDNNQPTSLQNEVFVEFPYYETETETEKNTKISPTSAVDFTLLALPYGIVNPLADYATQPYLTDLWLEVTFKKENGEEFTKKLALKQTTTNEDVTTTAFLKFASCKKYRINGLAVDGGSKWKLDVNGQVLPWQGYEAKIDDQVSIMPESFKIFGAIESTSQWQKYEIIEGTDPVQYKNAAGNNKANHYYDSNWVPFGREGYGQGEDNYDKKYQLRYLNRDGQGYFTVQFTPTAPTGGYWQLIPTFKDGDTMSPNHFRFEVVHPGGAVSDQLKGQILYQPVTIRIYPKDYAFSDQNIYDMWFTCYFSPSSNFTPSISADSEFQDVHGDGRFSYWVFRLAPYEGHFVDE